MPTASERWFADVLRAGLDTHVLNEEDILTHATPAVLAAALPRDVVVKVIEATLASGTMSHKAIVEVASIDLLAEKVPANLIWTCIVRASERAGIVDGVPKDEGLAREWLRKILLSGLSTGVFAPKDVIQHVDAKVLGTSLPDALTTKLLEATLAAGKMNPAIIVETIGADNLAKHVATQILWNVYATAAASVGASATATTPAATTAASSVTTSATPPPAAKPAGEKPSLEFIDEDVNTVLVELEDAAFEAESKAKPAAKEKARARPA